MLPLQSYKLRQMPCNHSLRARHHRNTTTQSHCNNPVGCGGIVNHLDNKIYLRISKYIIGIIGDDRRVNCNRPRLGEIAHTNTAYTRICILYPRKHFVNTLSHCAKAKKAYRYFLFHCLCHFLYELYEWPEYRIKICMLNKKTIMAKIG